MSTYGAIKSRIADELDRTDLSSQISLSVQSAIKFYEYECFWFNESRSITFDTVADQEFYDDGDSEYIPNLLMIHAVTVTVNSQRYKVEPRTYQTLEEWAVNTSTTGEPTDYAYYAQQLRLFPIPDAAYTVRISARIRFQELSADGDTNAWMTDAEELIRARAKADVFETALFDTVNSDRMRGYEAQSLMRLRAETGRRLGTGVIVPTYF